MSESFDRGLAADLLCHEETKSLCFFEDDATNAQKGRSESGPSIFLDEDFIGRMVERESEHLPRDDYLMRLRAGELDVGLRRDALDWMIKACARHNFGELCLCLAMNYLDRFLSFHNLPGGKSWMVHLAAVACLSLAAKMDDVNVPNAVHLQAGEPRFEGKTICRMEVLVLNYLKWNIKPHTPLNMVEHFLLKMNGNIETPSGPLLTRSTQIILSTTKGIDFLEFKPSEIAASVAVYVSGEKRAVDIDKTLSGFLIVEKGRVMKCLEMIKDLVLVGGRGCFCSTAFTTASGSQTGSVLSNHSPNGVLDASCLSYKSGETRVDSLSSTSGPDKKRRRLGDS